MKILGFIALGLAIIAAAGWAIGMTLLFRNMCKDAVEFVQGLGRRR